MRIIISEEQRQSAKRLNEKVFYVLICRKYHFIKKVGLGILQFYLEKDKIMVGLAFFKTEDQSPPAVAWGVQE